MKRLIIGIVIALLICITVYRKNPTYFKRTIVYEIEDLDDILTAENKKTSVFFDLRDKDDYQRMHISNFLNVSYEKNLTDLIHYLERNKLKSYKIYLMCYSGKRSGNAFNILEKKGYKNLYYIKFGFDAFYEFTNGDTTFKTGTCKCEEK